MTSSCYFLTFSNNTFYYSKLYCLDSGPDASKPPKIGSKGVSKTTNCNILTFDNFLSVLQSKTGSLHCVNRGIMTRKGATVSYEAQKAVTALYTKRFTYGRFGQYTSHNEFDGNAVIARIYEERMLTLDSFRISVLIEHVQKWQPCTLIYPLYGTTCNRRPPPINTKHAKTTRCMV